MQLAWLASRSNPEGLLLPICLALLKMETSDENTCIIDKQLIVTQYRNKL
jgi:hypothetical protein